MPHSLEAITTEASRAEKQVLLGFEWSQARHLASLLDVSTKRLAEILNISPATMQRRRAACRFSVRESDRIVRIAHLWFLACRTVGGREGACSWLKRRQRGLGGRVPLDVAQLEIGARMIETLLRRMHYNVIT